MGSIKSGAINFDFYDLRSTLRLGMSVNHYGCLSVYIYMSQSRGILSTYVLILIVSIHVYYSTTVIQNVPLGKRCVTKMKRIAYFGRFFIYLMERG